MKKGQIILTSGGYLDGQRGEKLDELIEKLSKDKRVLLVDNATITGSNTKGIPNIVLNFENIGATIDVLTLKSENLEAVDQYDVVYITGGDVTPLIDLANNTGFKNKIEQFCLSGGIVIGESAGSIIFGKDSKWYYDVKRGTKPKYDVNLPTYEGLGLTDINIYPHWNRASEEAKQKAKDYEKESGTKITPLNDGEWIAVDLKKALVCEE